MSCFDKALFVCLLLVQQHLLGLILEVCLNMTKNDLPSPVEMFRYDQGWIFEV